MNIQNLKGYAVLRDGKVLTTLRTRELARMVKAEMGGKENGVTIVQLKAIGEVR